MLGNSVVRQISLLPVSGIEVELRLEASDITNDSRAQLVEAVVRCGEAGELTRLGGEDVLELLVPTLSRNKNTLFCFIECRSYGFGGVVGDAEIQAQRAGLEYDGSGNGVVIDNEPGIVWTMGELLRSSSGICSRRIYTAVTPMAGAARHG